MGEVCLFMCNFVKDFCHTFKACKFKLLFLRDHTVTWTKHACFLERYLKILSCWCTTDFFFRHVELLSVFWQQSESFDFTVIPFTATICSREKIYSLLVNDCGIFSSYNSVPVTALLYSLNWAMEITVHGWLSSDLQEGVLSQGFGKVANINPNKM